MYHRLAWFGSVARAIRSATTPARMLSELLPRTDFDFSLARNFYIRGQLYVLDTPFYLAGFSAKTSPTNFVLKASEAVRSVSAQLGKKLLQSFSLVASKIGLSSQA